MEGRGVRGVGETPGEEGGTAAHIAGWLMAVPGELLVHKGISLVEGVLLRV